MLQKEILKIPDKEFCPSHKLFKILHPVYNKIKRFSRDVKSLFDVTGKRPCLGNNVSFLDQ